MVSTCIALNEDLLAVRCIEKMEGWRRGLATANYAYRLAQRGEREKARHYLGLVVDLLVPLGAVTEEDTGSQTWQKERILARIAGAYTLLGEPEQAARHGQGLGEAEVGVLLAARAGAASGAELDSHILLVEQLFANGSFDQARSALAICAELFDRLRDDPERAAKLGVTMRAGWTRVPLFVRIEGLADMARRAADRQDFVKTLELVAEAEGLADQGAWTAQDGIAMGAKLAGLRHAAGDPVRARELLDREVAAYAARRGEINDIDRCDVVLALAEAFHLAGHESEALRHYRTALEESLTNPNSRPRAEDLAAICCSMARCDVEPDEALRARLVQVCDGLGNPW